MNASRELCLLPKRRSVVYKNVSLPITWLGVNLKADVFESLNQRREKHEKSIGITFSNSDGIRIGGM